MSPTKIVFSCLLAVALAPLVSAQVVVTRTFTPGLVIPDSGEAADVRTVDVGGGTITNLQVGIGMSGVNGSMYNGDYYVTIGHNSASAVLLNRPGVTGSDAFGYSDNGFTVTFSDSAANGDVHTYRNTTGSLSGGALTGTWAPDGRLTDPTGDSSTRTNLLSAFNGQAASGEWRIFVADQGAGATGRLDYWHIAMTVTPDGTTQLQLNDSQLSAASAQSFANPVSVSGASRIVATSDVTFQGALSGSGSLTKENSGRLVLPNANSFTGSLAVTGGTIELPAGLSGSGGGISVGSGGTLTAAGSITRDIAHQGTITGPAVGSGQFLTLSGAVTGAGNYTGRIAMNGSFSPGNSPAAVTVTGDLTLGSTNLLTMEIGGTTAGTSYDQLVVSNTITFGGTLQVSLINGYTPSGGESYRLFNAGNYASAFSTQTFASLPNGFQWDASQLTSTGMLSVTAIPEPTTIALWSGSAALVAVLWRRRRLVRRNEGELMKL